MDFDSDIQTKVVRVNRTYNVYRGTSPSTQNRLEVSEVCPLCRLLLTIVICAFVKENLLFSGNNISLLLFLKSASPNLQQKVFSCELLCLFIFMLIVRICIKHRTSKTIRGKSINLLLWYGNIITLGRSALKMDCKKPRFGKYAFLCVNTKHLRGII